ncbi:TRAP transporter substrate-binding protein [Sulfitobacter sp. F26169L]|uniref:TRAP transporter substrate-binding protein n=1 Tax=Sulfitobacter sp. F26169L TaxID=2996015 RepID=UPI002260D8E0|nr:TRAP transporter substrate-binding protein [Sulfitobacter sp. F26169L]MCX7565974.1 TRAP transporter substrate-binding protein [Sulfitobacter sp. F26169L]
MNKTNKLTVWLTAAAAAMSFTAANAQETTLTISAWAPPTHGVNAKMFPDLIRRIEEATDGRVTAEMKFNLAPPPAQADIITDGIADIAWIVHNYSPGRFPSATIAELPGFGGSAEAYSVAYWRTFEKFFAQANEHRDLKVLALHSHGDGMLHSSTEIETLDQIAGMKLRIGGGVAGLVGEALEASAINVPAPRVYETLDSNAADGVLMPMEAKLGFRLTEVAEHSYQMPSGFYHTSSATVMNQDAFNALSKEDQAALDELFGEELSRITGAYWDEFDADGFAALEAAGDNTFRTASESDQAAWAVKSDAIVAEVLDSFPAKNIDAPAAYEFFKAEFSRLKDGG